jgi:hypothetical protein
LKVWRSRHQSSASVLAVIVAALGALYKRESSPNASPGLYSFKNVGSEFPFYSKIMIKKNLTKIFVQVKTPLSTTYKQSPSSPSVMTA